MPESNPLRNSRLQTHQDDGIGAKTEAAPSRFCITTSDWQICSCLKNSHLSAPLVFRATAESNLYDFFFFLSIVLRKR